MNDPRDPKPGVPNDGGNKGTQKPDPRQPGVDGDGGNRAGNERGGQTDNR